MSMGFLFRFVHKNKDDEILYDSGWNPNQIADEGFINMFDIYFRGATPPDKFALGLLKSNATKNNSYDGDDLDELAGTNTGYALLDILRDDSANGFPTLNLDGENNVQIISTRVEFENTGITEWETATHGFLIAVYEGVPDTHTFVSWQALTVPRTLQPSDKLEVDVIQKGKLPQE